MPDSPTDIKGPDGGEKPDGGEGLRMAEAPPLPVTGARSAEACALEKLNDRGFRVKETRPPVDDQSRSIRWGPVVFALVILLAAGAGLWRWRMTTKPKTVVIETPLEYHKRQFLTALRGDGSNAVPMQVRADRMRFHQRALLSQGFLAERKFVFTNGAAKASVAVNRIEGVSMEYAMVEPRGKDVLAVIAPRDDMPAWESLMRLSGAK